MDPKQFYLKCLEQASSVVKQVLTENLTNQTPDDEWSTRDLINHMLQEVVWLPAMVQGRTMAEVGDQFDGDLLEVNNDEVDTTWQSAATKAEQAVTDCDLDATAHLSYADVDNREYVSMTGGDILVHTWDLARAISIPFQFDTQAAAYMWQSVKDRDMSGSGMFKPSRDYADDDSHQEKILAKFGRDSTWQASA